MSDELDKILISSDAGDFSKRIDDLHWKLLRAARFGGFDKESKTNRDAVHKLRGDVDEHGYEVVREWTKQYDGVDLKRDAFQVPEGVLREAHKHIGQELLASIRKAIDNVREYQARIFVGAKTHWFGNTGIKYTVLQRVGVCVPGGSAPLASTVIMTAVPAQVAGVAEIVVVSPPRYNGDIHPVTLGVCYELGISEVYRVGGAQAVVTLASDKVIKKVDKIVGPGNQWVQSAKKEAFGGVDIDSVAGPSEVLIIADDGANPCWVAADMLSQAEHDPGSAVLFTDSEHFAGQVLAELRKQLVELGRCERTTRCLLEFSRIVIFESMTEVIKQANEFAAEHLQIQCGEKSREIADQIDNAGAIFIGEYSPVAVGDYWAGPSHTLPTGQTAKFFSPLSANDFIKSTSIIEYSAEQLASSAEDIIRLAEVEGLDAHARSVRIRQEG
ncbi:MAG: histidinol dehydrogenase [Sedimentisphaerales bacterium]|nr:histidinol dehydrogenase [Sedimentisphaerales bacterium]